MQNPARFVVGAFLVLLGTGFLLANLLQISLWSICFPASLIMIGVLLLLRPRAIWRKFLQQLVSVRRCQARR